MDWYLHTPITKEDIKKLHIGDRVFITGTIYTARDAAHKKLLELIDQKEQLPFELNNSIIYYTGPAPKKENEAIGPCGPTSSYRMDKYSNLLFPYGQLISIGKGTRSEEYKQKLKEAGGIYLSTVGGMAVLIASSVKKADVIAFPWLGAEAIHKLEVENFSTIVTYDSYGKDLFIEGTNTYKK